ncbi:hypothetical protein RhiirA1_407170 [Rhizophagus irregularis]|nr:hypothetical protein RhiirA1_407170 [Rhizophagus irregularis]PKY14276.1 hypothetical protein RhiirB3_400063 [Rhizophagus irregularis]
MKSSNLAPELLGQIFSHLEYDLNTLYSCLLVSRIWCKSTVPLLYKQPFHLCPTYNHKKLINLYLPWLSKESLTLLGLHKKIIERKSIFKYPYYIRHLNFFEVYEASWTLWHDEYSNNNDDLEDNFNKFKLNLLNRSNEDQNLDKEEEILVSLCDYDDDDDSEDDYEDHDTIYDETADESYPSHYILNKRIIAMTHELFKLFMENCPYIDGLNLSTIDLEFYHGLYFKEYLSLPLLPSAFKCLSRLQKFVCGGNFYKKSIINSMIKYCHNLNEIEIIFNPDYDESTDWAPLIQAQKKLENLTFSLVDYGIAEIFKSLEIHFDTLTSLEFNSCSFNDCCPFKALYDFTNLKSLIFLYCGDLTYDDENEIISGHNRLFYTYPFPTLKKLQFDYSYPNETQLLRMISGEDTESLYCNLEEIILNFENSIHPDVIECIAEDCINLKKIDLTENGNDNSHFESLFPIFKNCNKLQSLHVRRGYRIASIRDKRPDPGVILEKIAEIMPFSMKELSIVVECAFTTYDVGIFLKKCLINLKYLSLRCIGSKNEIKKVLKEYAFRNNVKIIECNFNKVGMRNDMRISSIEKVFDFIVRFA